MINDWNIIPEAAKAITAPITKLLDVIATGCGNIYKSVDNDKFPKNNETFLAIIEEAQSRKSSLSVRAVQRLLDTEERRQINIETICRSAIPLLSTEAAQEPVERDWAIRFFNECQDISDEQMRIVWARILAGEVSQPGSFSKRTLSILKDMTAEEANSFNDLCKTSFRSPNDNIIYPMLRDQNDRNYFDSIGLDFMKIKRLIDAGLVSDHPTNLAIAGTTGYVIAGSGLSILAESESPANLYLGKLGTTASGTELARICEWDIPKERFESVFLSIKHPFRATSVRITHIDENGMIHTNPVSQSS